MSQPAAIATSAAHRIAPAKAVALPDADDPDRKELQHLHDLEKAMTEARDTASLSLARTRALFEGPTAPGVALPHIQVCGMLGARLISVYERCLRTYGRQRHEIAGRGGRAQQD